MISNVSIFRQPVHEDAFGPFSPSIWAQLRQDSAVQGHDPIRQAGITAPAIPEGRAADTLPPRARITDPDPEAGAVTRLAPGGNSLPDDIPTLPVDAARLRTRPIPRQSGLRLLPLESFAWGGRMPQVQPRTRGDHVLIWVTQGTLQLDFPRLNRSLGAGTVQYIPAGTAFSTLPAQGTTGHVLLIARDMLRDLSADFPDHAVSGMIGEAAPALLAHLHDLAEEARAERPQARQAIGLQLSLLALRLARLQPAPQRISAGTGAPPDLALIARFLRLAGTRLATGETVADLAGTLGTTTAALDSACLKAHGKRAIQMIHDLRYERAVEALRHTDRSTPRIARDLGYPSHANFIRRFVARSGRLPETFRQQSIAG